MTGVAVTIIITAEDITKKHYGKVLYTEEVIVTNSSFSIAVHALVYLNHMEKVLSSEELAQNVCTNPVLIRKVMSKLKKAGLHWSRLPRR